MTVVILGATKGIGRAVARRLIERGDRLCLLGRDIAELERSAQDLKIRGGSGLQIAVAACDLARPDTFAPALDAAAAALGHVDIVIVAAADFATQEALETDRNHLQQLLSVNFSNTILFCEDARRRLLSAGGTLCVVSSVAGDRGRKPVILYGAAKAGLSHYLEGLDHKFHGQGLRVVCVKPGFVKTGMTAGLRPPPFAGEPDGVALDIVRAIDRGTPVVYTPRIWALIMLVIRWLPRAAMRKVGF
jgi:decaprenylphospho-beta-D-erythro-pentofuranosid-2-ulose 2-reductase